MFSRDPTKFAELVEAHMTNEEVDVEWAAETGEKLEQWLGSRLQANTFDYSLECVSDVCFVDFLITQSDYMRSVVPHMADWRNDRVSGMLRTNIFVSAGEDYIRSYVFRDTFDPESL